MKTVHGVLAAHGGVAPRAAFTDAGITPYRLGEARHSGEIFRVRRGWYAEPRADPEVVSAVRVGGALTCSSWLRREGVWLRDDDRLHVAVSANASRLRLDPATPDQVVIHWRPENRSIARSVEPIAESLAHLAMCESPEFALVALDSALNLKLVTVPALERAFRHLPDTARRLLSQIDPDSQSGLETLSRCRLRRRGIRLRTQVFIEGIGRVDVLIGDRLILELDGRGFHSGAPEFDEDRRRDVAAHGLGYRVVRLTYSQVMHEWAQAEATIRAMIARRDHLWPRRRLVPIQDERAS